MAQDPRPAEPPPDASVGRKAVELGLLSEPQLTQVLQDLSRQVPPPPLADALVSRGLLTPLQVQGLLSGGLGAAATRIGKYRLVRELGRGGMGVVYEAEDVDLKRRCALKTLLESEFADSRDRALEEERFIREARLSANLPKHPGIVGVYEAGVVDGRRILAMELVEGAQLQDWYRKTSPPLRLQVQVLRDVAEAVAHAHRHGVIHRDLKPSNILVDGEGRAHITDFGLAKRSRETTMLSLTATGTVVGTPAYMSPEQAEGTDAVGPASDQWALGVMLYEILAGRLPFRGDTAVEVLMKTVKEPVVPPTRALRDPSRKIDERLEGICLRALQKDPARRFPGVDAFAAGLAAWLQDGFAPTAEGKRKRGAAAALAAGLAFLLLLVFLLRTPSADPAELRRETVERLLADGRRLLDRKNYADALIAFGRVLAEEPGNAAAEKGRLEAERFLRAPTPDAEAAGFVVAYRKLLDDGKIPEAVARIEEAEARRLAGPWPAALAEQRTVLARKLEALFPGLRDRAVQAKLRRGGAELARLTREVELWKSPDHVAALQAALDRTELPPSAITLPAGVRERPAMKPHGNGVSLVAFSPDGRRLLSGGFDNTARLWDLSRPAAPLQEWRYAERSTSAAFSPDGRWFAVGVGDATVRLHDARTLKERTLGGHETQVVGVAFSPDSRLLYSCSTDGSIRAWSTAEGTTQRIFTQHARGAMSLACSPDGKTLAGGAASGEIKIWEAATGRWLRTLASAPPESEVVTLAFSPDGALLASGAEDGRLVLWDPAGGEGRPFARHAPKLHHLAWSPDGRRLVSAADDGALRFWDLPTGSLHSQFHGGAGWYAAAFSADGRLLAGGTRDWHVRIFELGP